jgi:hypothetical protein
MDPRTFLDVANQLQTSATEAGRRTSIGRSYYALFNILRVSLESQGISFKKSAADHGRLVRYLTQCGNHEAVRVGQALRDLREQRNQADYEMSLTLDARQSQLAYQQAQKAVQRFDTLSPVDMQNIIRSIQALPVVSSRRPPRL